MQLFLFIAEVAGVDPWLQYGALGVLAVFIVVVFNKLWEFGKSILEILAKLVASINSATDKFTTEMVAASKDREDSSEKLHSIHQDVVQIKHQTGQILAHQEGRK